MTRGRPLIISLGCLWSLMLGALTGCDATPRVVIEGQDGRKASFAVEIADTHTKRAFGLKYRRDLKTDQGMLFIFPEEKIHVFWMKDTPLSLDMIFIGRGRKIVGIVSETTPFSTEARSVSAPSQFVLEVRGGVSRQRGLRVGDTVSFESIPGFDP